MAYIVKLIKAGFQLLGKNWGSLLSAQIVEELVPIVSQNTKYGTIRFFCPARLPALRAHNFLSKEPETIKWINAFDDTDVLWDIGANIGVFTLYAARKGNTVVSFEPSSGNYYLLNKNIEINQLDDRVFTFPIAFNDATILESIYFSNSELGGSLNSFAKAINFLGEPFIASLRQSAIGFSIDDFVQKFSPLFPNHIKYGC